VKAEDIASYENYDTPGGVACLARRGVRHCRLSCHQRQQGIGFIQQTLSFTKLRFDLTTYRGKALNFFKVSFENIWVRTPNFYFHMTFYVFERYNQHY